MLFRIVSFLIVAFWLIMSGLLVQLVYFPEESRLSVADPEYVIGLFLRNDEVNELQVFRGREVVGEVKIQAKRPGTGGRPRGARDIQFWASGMVALPNMPEQKLHWDGMLRLAEDRSLERVEITVRFQEPNVQLKVTIHPHTRAFEYEVIQESEVIATSGSGDPDAPGAAQMRLLLAAWGVNPETLENPEVAAAEQRRLANLSARHGEIEVSGHRIHAYILTLRVMGEREIKFYLTEAGELVRVTTFLGYELLSGVVAPLKEPEESTRGPRSSP